MVLPNTHKCCLASQAKQESKNSVVGFSSSVLVSLTGVQNCETVLSSVSNSSYWSSNMQQKTPKIFSSKYFSRCLISKGLRYRAEPSCKFVHFNLEWYSSKATFSPNELLYCLWKGLHLTGPFCVHIAIVRFVPIIMMVFIIWITWRIWAFFANVFLQLPNLEHRNGKSKSTLRASVEPNNFFC